MSDCRVSKWANVEWRTPDGRTVYVPAGDEACDVQVVFTDGTTRDLTIVLAGREVACVLVDGNPYRPDDPDETWDVEGGCITAINVGEVRYERVG